MKEQTFEQKLKRLEKIVEELESGKTDLDKAVTLFEEGSQISSELTQKLKTVKFTVSQLKEKQGELALEPFEQSEEL